MPTQQDDEYRARLLKRLALVADESRPEEIRLAATSAVQKMLPVGNPLRSIPAEELLNQAKRPWQTRLVLQDGRGVERRVQRPPQSIADVW
jgi:hypothetical protein